MNTEHDDLSRLIAAGSRENRGDIDAAVWTSENGEDWRLQSEFGGEGDQRIVALAARRLPVIAVVEDQGAVPGRSRRVALRLR